jgi:hypothetical protein
MPVGRRRPRRPRAVELARDDLHGHRARHLSGGVPPHPVGDDEQPAARRGVGVEAVFVARADASDVRAGGHGKLHGWQAGRGEV